MESSSAMLPSSALSTPLKLLGRVLKLKVNDAVYEYLVQYVTAMVKVHPDDAHISGPSTSSLQPGKQPKISNSNTLTSEDKPLPNLHDFIENISIRSRCTMSTILVAIIYLDRLQKIITPKQPTVGKPCARHRVIFSALMISHKIWNDSSMIGKHWAEVSNLFTSQEVLAMEREILVLLRYDLELTVEEIWVAARPFLKKPFLSVNVKLLVAAEADFGAASKTRHEGVVLNQPKTQQQQNPSPAYPATIPLPVAAPAAIHFSQQTHQPSSHEAQPLHPYSSLHCSSLPDNDGPPSQVQSTCSSPAPFDPSETPFYSPALHSSPLLTSPSLQVIHRPVGVNPSIISLSRTHTTRSSAGSTTRTTTRSTMRKASQVAAASKNTSVHPYLHNLPQHHHAHPIIVPVARLKKKYIASAQRFHLPTSMHLHSTLRFGHSSSSPLHSNLSSSGSSSSSISTSIPSSPSGHSAGSGISVYAQSPPMAWYAFPQQYYNEYRHSYASTIALPPSATVGP